MHLVRLTDLCVVLARFHLHLGPIHISVIAPSSHYPYSHTDVIGVVVWCLILGWLFIMRKVLVVVIFVTLVGLRVLAAGFSRLHL